MGDKLGMTAEQRRSSFEYVATRASREHLTELYQSNYECDTSYQDHSYLLTGQKAEYCTV